MPVAAPDPSAGDSLGQPGGVVPGVRAASLEAMFRGWLRAYEWTLDLVLRAKFLVLLVTFGTLAGTA